MCGVADEWKGRPRKKQGQATVRTHRTAGTPWTRSPAADGATCLHSVSCTFNPAGRQPQRRIGAWARQKTAATPQPVLCAPAAGCLPACQRSPAVGTCGRPAATLIQRAIERLARLSAGTELGALGSPPAHGTVRRRQARRRGTPQTPPFACPARIQVCVRLRSANQREPAGLRIVSGPAGPAVAGGHGSRLAGCAPHSPPPFPAFAAPPQSQWHRPREPRRRRPRVRAAGRPVAAGAGALHRWLAAAAVIAGSWERSASPPAPPTRVDR